MHHTAVFADICTVSRSSASKVLSVENVTLTGISDSEKISDYVTIRHRTDSEEVIFPQNTVVTTVGTASALFTEKLCDVLHASAGDNVRVKLSDGREIVLTVSDIIENHVNNYIYMDQKDLNVLCEGDARPNQFLFSYKPGTPENEIDTLSSELVSMDNASSYYNIHSQIDRFQKSLAAVNSAVYIIIVAAAALAFVVLYNLTNINVTERIRELATLKVLGFTDAETTSYIYRENVVMTVFGIIFGLIAGKYLVIWLMSTVENEYMMFGRDVSLRSYLLSAAFTLAFSLFVNVIAHFVIRKINMVESLKSVE
jgi:putative ABC transport system permease protein